MKKVFFVAFFLLLIFSLVSEVVSVEIISNAEDSNGQRLVTKLRDIIRKSPTYQLVYSDNEPHFVIKIDTMDKFKGDSLSEGVATIYNYTILLHMESGIRFYLYSQLGYAGKNTLNDVAEDIYSDLDEFLELFKKMLIQYFED